MPRLNVLIFKVLKRKNVDFLKRTPIKKGCLTLLQAALHHTMVSGGHYRGCYTVFKKFKLGFNFIQKYNLKMPSGIPNFGEVSGLK